MPGYDGGICKNIGFLVDTVKARGGTMSRGTRKGAVIRCLTLRRQVFTTARRRRGRSRVNRTGNDAWRHDRNQRRIVTPPDCTCTKAIDNVAADRATDSRRAGRRVSLLTRMKDVNSLMEVLLTTCKTCDSSPGRLPLKTYLRDPQRLPKESNKTAP